MLCEPELTGNWRLTAALDAIGLAGRTALGRRGLDELFGARNAALAFKVLEFSK